MADDTAHDGVVDPSATPDVGLDRGFRLDPADVPDLEAQAAELTRRIARELAMAAPEGWERVDAVFSLTVVAEVVQVFYSVGEQAVRIEPAESTMRMVRQERVLSGRLDSGPWWRLVLGLARTGELEVDHDYGDEPFPDAHMLPPQAYRADVTAYPRDRLPTWLAAYVGHEDRQSRSPQHAAAAARTNRVNKVRASLAGLDLRHHRLMPAGE